MRLFYDVVFLIVSFIYLPAYLFRRRFDRSFLMRLGILPASLELGRPIWIHAVSVGEAMAVRGLVGELKKAYPEKKFVISTITATGNKIAASISAEGDFITYLPLDFSFIVRNVINKLNPCLFILTETEIWPNLLSCLYRKRIPVVLVNGRISDVSFKRYSCIKFLLRPVLEKVSLFCVQTERDAQRFMRLGVAKDKIHVTGNMKFDAPAATNHKQALMPGSNLRYIVAGSTHPGEEEVILGAFRQLRREFSALALIIAPRHPERAADIERMILEAGFTAQRISALDEPLDRQAACECVFILDTVGELMFYYEVADIVFVGGSLIKKGGHNILEPASKGKPVLFGPYMFNFRDIADLFLNKKAAVLVRNQDEIKKSAAYLLSNPQEAARLGKAASELVLENQGATKRNLDFIRRLK